MKFDYWHVINSYNTWTLNGRDCPIFLITNTNIIVTNCDYSVYSHIWGTHRHLRELSPSTSTCGFFRDEKYLSSLYLFIYIHIYINTTRLNLQKGKAHHMERYIDKNVVNSRVAATSSIHYFCLFTYNISNFIQFRFVVYVYL